jgi:hypothetical protein
MPHHQPAPAWFEKGEEGATKRYREGYYDVAPMSTAAVFPRHEGPGYHTRRRAGPVPRDMWLYYVRNRASHG